jgi:plastocyanin
MRRSLVRYRNTLGLVALAATVLAGCASVPDGARDAVAFECPLGTEGCDVNQPVGPGGDMAVVASVDGEFSFGIEDGAAATGDIVMNFENTGSGVHNVEALGAAEGSQVVEAQPGESSEGEILLFPGEWTIICNISGHRANGMEATVTVYATEEEAEEAEAANEGEGGDAEPDEADAEAEEADGEEADAEEA